MMVGRGGAAGEARLGPQGRPCPAGRAPAAPSFRGLARTRGLRDLSGDGGVLKEELRPGTGQAVPPAASVAGTAGAPGPAVLSRPKCPCSSRGPREVMRQRLGTTLSRSPAWFSRLLPGCVSSAPRHQPGVLQGVLREPAAWLPRGFGALCGNVVPFFVGTNLQGPLTVSGAAFFVNGNC